MKNYYDKILFILALAILGAGIAFFALKQGTLSGMHAEGPDTSPTGGAVEQIEIETFADQPADLPVARAQDPEGNWLFDLFTPPEIYWSPEEGWIAIPPDIGRTGKPVRPIIAQFGVELIDITREFYHAQLIGYSGGTGREGEPTLLEFVVRTNGGQWQPRGVMVGESIEDVGVEIRDFRVEKEITEDEQGTVIRTIGIATVFDREIGRELELRDDKREIVEDQFVVRMRATSPPYLNSSTFTWEQIGAQQTIEGEDPVGPYTVTYTLDNFNMEPEKTATVTRTSAVLEAPETKELTPQAVPANNNEKPANTGRSQPKEEEAEEEEIPFNIFN